MNQQPRERGPLDEPAEQWAREVAPFVDDPPVRLVEVHCGYGSCNDVIAIVFSTTRGRVLATRTGERLPRGLVAQTRPRPEAERGWLPSVHGAIYEWLDEADWVSTTDLAFCHRHGVRLFNDIEVLERSAEQHARRSRRPWSVAAWDWDL